MSTLILAARIIRAGALLTIQLFSIVHAHVLAAQVPDARTQRIQHAHMVLRTIRLHALVRERLLILEKKYDFILFIIFSTKVIAPLVLLDLAARNARPLTAPLAY
jgi:hypothetical protein